MNAIATFVPDTLWAARASLTKVMEWDFDKMILAHGHLIDSNAKDVFYRAYRFLLG